MKVIVHPLSWQSGCGLCGDEGLRLLLNACIGMRRGDEGQQEWFGQLRCICSAQRPRHSAAELCALVRWYEPLPRKQKGTGMTCLQWQRWRGNPGRYDLVWAQSILRPVVLQPHPTRKDTWVHNHLF